MSETEAATARTEPERPPGLVDVVPASRLWNVCKPRQSRLRWLLLRERHEPPVSVLGPIREPAVQRRGICCSGGGIRSASFNLGALQVIQEDERLEKMDYLSAVSGGSYIAAAFSIVAKSRDGGTNDPEGDESDAGLVTRERPPFYEGSPEEQYLRNRASYLAPTGSAKAFLVWRVLLGLLVNLVLIGAVVALVAAVLTLYYRSAHGGLIRPPTGAAGASPNGWVWGTGLGISLIGILLGGASIVLRPRQREGFRRFLEVWSLPVFAVGVVVFALEVVVPELIEALRADDDEVGAQQAVGAGFSATVAAIVGTIVLQLRAQIADPGKAIARAQGWLQKLAPRLRLFVIYVATLVLGPLLIFAMLVAAVTVQVETTNTDVRVGVPVAAALLLCLFARFGDLNSWSLHPFYRRRLCTAFALRRIKHTGDPEEGHAEARKEGELVPLSKTAVTPGDLTWPTLLVCAAANVSDPGAAPPGRGVTSFTFSAFEMGGPLVGGIDTAMFEDRVSPNRQRDFTLPAAVAMSGAAISPSMGKETRASIRFLMGMANVRLGVWLPNPRRLDAFVKLRSSLRQQVGDGIGENTRALLRPASFKVAERERAIHRAERKKRWMPRPTPRYLLKELLGWNSINDKFLYVTDGGHYENLGLVELLRRGCTEIYCLDASGGKQVGAALGDAIALARSELGVEIVFPDDELEKLEEKEGIAQARCATGTIKYLRSKPVVQGTIVYAPTVMTKDLPWDVRAFKKRDDVFPHHSTVDQLFSDQKFEAYRVLGRYAGISAINAMDAALKKPQATVTATAPATVPENGDAEGPPPPLFDELVATLRRRLLGNS